MPAAVRIKTAVIRKKAHPGDLLRLPVRLGLKILLVLLRRLGLNALKGSFFLAHFSKIFLAITAPCAELNNLFIQYLILKICRYMSFFCRKRHK